MTDENVNRRWSNKNENDGDESTMIRGGSTKWDLSPSPFKKCPDFSILTIWFTTLAQSANVCLKRVEENLCLFKKEYDEISLKNSPALAPPPPPLGKVLNPPLLNVNSMVYIGKHLHLQYSLMVRRLYTNIRGS